MNFIIYSNSSYLDVLQIQTDYITKNNNDVILFIDNNNLDLSEIYNKYKEVIFYNENDTYATRVLSCLKQIKYDYFVFIHDIDILLDYNKNVLFDLYNTAKEYNYDRIDLKYSNKLLDNKIRFNNSGLYIIPQTNPSDYIYNVNPSIWKKNSFIEILENFKHKTYRTIEDMDVQNFCVKYKIFKLYSETFLKCGYFECVDIFKFLHISHNGKLLPLNKTYTTVYGQPYTDIKDEYLDIVDKYNLTYSPKWIL